jgi:hypothetical protein
VPGPSLSSASSRARSARSAPAAAWRNVTPRSPASSIIASVAGVILIRQTTVKVSTPPAAIDASSLPYGTPHARSRHSATWRRRSSGERSGSRRTSSDSGRCTAGSRSSVSSAATCGPSPERGVPSASRPRSPPTITWSIARATTRPRPSSSPWVSAVCTASTSSRRPGAASPRSRASDSATSAAAFASGTLAGSPRARIPRVISTRHAATSPATSPPSRSVCHSRCCHLGSRIPAG